MLSHVLGILPRSCLRWQLKRSNDTFASKTAYDSHAKLSSLSHAELIARAKNLHKMLVQSQKKKGKRCYSLYLKEKQKHITAPTNYKPKSSDLSKLMDIAIENKWLAENSVLYVLLTDTLKSLKKQEQEIARYGKWTKKWEKATPQRNEVQPPCDQVDLHDSQ